MPIEILVGLAVTDDAGYQRYRAGMRPILTRFGGRFVLDVRVAEILEAPGDGPFNRLFTIRFPSEAVMAAFFADPTYQAVRAAHFEAAVGHTALLSKYAVLP